MTHFGILTPGAATGPLNTMLPLGQELQRRGHRVTLFGVADAQSKVEAAGIEFIPLGETEYPVGSSANILQQLGELKGLAALQYTIQALKRLCAINLQYAPSAMREAQVEALLVNQGVAEGGSIADVLGIPFITVGSAVVLNQDPIIPPFFTSWPYSTSVWARLRNQFGYSLLNLVALPMGNLIHQYRKAQALPRYAKPNDAYSKLAQLSQAPIEFEFPRQNLPPWFHFTGTYHTPSSRAAVPFPYEKLTEQPLIYASMGTLQNRIVEVFQTIATACEGLDAQLVISLGGSAQPEDLPRLAGDPIVVSYAPQLELLARATLMITHAGMNTTMECVKHGVPMVAIPVANDQPGVAARIAWTGVGEMIPLKQLNVDKLRSAVQRVLTQPSYKENALRLQSATNRAGGVQRAADIIEQAITTGKPVLA
ncbi:MAG: glycosyltransferase [Leptolyngbya sp. BL-A-14]